MTTTLYAQPYDISAVGFYFESAEDYAAKAAALRNARGQPVEEFEVQFIDGEAIDAALCEALGLHQGCLATVFERLEEWDDYQKRLAIVAAGECGEAFGWEDDPDRLEIDLYEMESLTDLAEHFVEEGLFGPIPEPLRFYIDHAAIARDLACDYAVTEIAGTRLVYRCG